MTEIFIYLFLLLIVIFLSALYSGSETGIYQISKVRLRIGVTGKRLSFKILDKCLKDSYALLLTILVGNNMTHYIATSIVTSLLLLKMQNERLVEITATVITAPTIFLFAELMPKNIFFYRADSVMPPVSPVLYLTKFVLRWTGILPVLGFITNRITRVTRKFQTTPSSTALRESYMTNILWETREEGLLSPMQSDIMFRLAEVGNLRLKDVMTSSKNVKLINVETDKKGLVEILRRYPYTRYPVYEKNQNNITGYINIYECLSKDEDFENIREFLYPIESFNLEMTVSNALNKMQDESLKIVLVFKRTIKGKNLPVGIVTMKDLVEEFLGELSSW